MNQQRKFLEMKLKGKKNGEKKNSVKRADLSINPLTY